jgi:peptidoglycan-associated lipoprotein
MIRGLFYVLVLSSLVIGGCSKKAKEDAGAGVTQETMQDQPMSFDTAGSDSGNIPGLGTIHFEYDKATLTTEARRVLKQNGEWIKEHPKVNMQVEGHCDERGSIEYNLSLGERRAKAAKNFLTSLGIDGARLNIISYGKEKLLQTGDSEEIHAKNRRANFLPLSQ